MLYDYRCRDCRFLQEEEAKVASFKELHPKCRECGGTCDYEFTPTVIQFAIKDGPSGTSPSKAIRVKNWRQKRHEELGRRQKDRYGHQRRDAVPNYQGKLTEDWSEAQSLAMKDKERNRDSLATAQTYAPHIKKERAKKKGLSA